MIITMTGGNRFSPTHNLFNNLNEINKYSMEFDCIKLSRFLMDQRLLKSSLNIENFGLIEGHK